MLTRKWSHVLMAVMLVVVMVIAGCSSSSNNAANKTKVEAAKDPVTIKLHTWYVKQTDKWDVLIAEFEKKHPHIKVEFVSAEDNNSTEYLKKLDLSAASGESLDVIMINSMATHVQRVELGMFEQLDDYLNKEGIKLKDEYTVDTSINGKIYGLPGKVIMPVVIINENHLKEAGLEVPKDWTWDEYMDYAKKMTKKDGNKIRYGTYFHSWPQYTYLSQINKAENANLTTDDGITANVDNPIIRNYLELRLQGEAEGSATPYAEVISQKLNYRPQYFNQDTSMLITWSFIIPETGGSQVVPANFKTVFAPFPKDIATDGISGNAAGDILALHKNSKHKEEAYEFIRWFTTEGISLQGISTPSWAKVNTEEVIDKIISSTASPDMIDKESLLYVLQNTVPTTPAVPVSYHAELDKIFMEQFDKMMLSNQDIDTTIKNAQEKIQKVIDSQKK